jgi:hypothetical protein
MWLAWILFLIKDTQIENNDRTKILLIQVLWAGFCLGASTDQSTSTLAQKLFLQHLSLGLFLVIFSVTYFFKEEKDESN